VGCSRCGPLSVGIVVVGKARVPPLEEAPKRTVKGTRSRLQQQVCASRRPLHLLTLGKAFADDSVHRGLGQARGNALAGAVSLTIIDQSGGVAGDVDGELVRGASEFAEVWVVHG